MPPWLVREFARANRCNALAGEQSDFEDLESILALDPASGGDIDRQRRPPDEVVIFFNAPENQYGTDLRLILLRNEGLVSPCG